MRKRHKKKLRRMGLLLGKMAIAARRAGQALRLNSRQALELAQRWPGPRG